MQVYCVRCKGREEFVDGRVSKRYNRNGKDIVVYEGECAGCNKKNKFSEVYV